MMIDIPELQYDDHQFSHFLDEALAFDKEIRSMFGVTSTQPTCLHVLSQDLPFNKWILIERKCKWSDSYKSKKIFTMFPFQLGDRFSNMAWI